MEDLLRDTAFPYHIGQLVGAVEVAAHWMSLADDPHTKEMGRKLEEVVGWFFEAPGNMPVARRPVSGDADTAVIR